MFSWEIYKPGIESGNWDDLVGECDDYNIHQSSGWGEYKTRSGWKVFRCFAKNKNQSPVCVVQFLYKSFFFGIKLFWAPGGPLFILKNFKKKQFSDILMGLFELIQSTFGNRVLIRFHSNCLSHPEASFMLNQIAAKPIVRINSGYSIMHDIREPIELLKKKMTAKHRYYLKKSLKNEIRWVHSNDRNSIVVFLDLYNEMIHSKSIGLPKYDQKELMFLAESLKENLLILTGFDAITEQPLTSCIVLKFRNTAFYSMAASGEYGRKNNISYSMIYQLWQILKAHDIEKFDFGGIGLINEAAGVNHFKKGFGGEIIEYLGEWEWSKSFLLRIVLNLAIKLRLSKN